MSEPTPRLDSFAARTTLDVHGRSYGIASIQALIDAGHESVNTLPFSLKVLLENLLRRENGGSVLKSHIEALIHWDPAAEPSTEIAFMPARVLLQDFTGVPAVVDLAAMRDATVERGLPASRVNPQVPVDLVIDHSVQVDHFGSPRAQTQNVKREYERNLERYEFLRWGAHAFKNFRVVPPGTGIVHQINLEHLASCVFEGGTKEEPELYPDSLVGTDSHTTMINGLGVLGWGVGGIEAEAGMLGQPISMLIPQVVGFKLTGALLPGTTATDLVLTVTQKLRAVGVVGKFVEFFGSGVDALSLADRATIANMAPEYGATIGFFPIDETTLDYLRFTGRDPSHVDTVEAYTRAQGLFRTVDSPDPRFTQLVSLDLGSVEPSLAGPKRPHDRVALSDMKRSFRETCDEMIAGRGGSKAPVVMTPAGTITDGALAIAAITSCTNTSNPSVMLAAGLVAKKARERGLKSHSWVKTSLAPGSRVVTRYLKEAGLLADLEAIGFNLVGYGCTTCIGNSGPLVPAVTKAVVDHDLVVASVLSGNRNFEGRVSPHTKTNYLASPPLVVAYALAGTVDIDLTQDPIGVDSSGNAVYLGDVWPSHDEVQAAVRSGVQPEQFREEYATVFEGDETWREIEVPEGAQFAWGRDSTYVRRPSFLENVPEQPTPPTDIQGARVLALLGDSVTTDHISPAGAIPEDGPAASWLLEHDVARSEFNSFGSRRGNHEVMVRGTFGNIRLRNQLAPGTEGGMTRHQPSDHEMSIYDASQRYQEAKTPTIVIAGGSYGMGSSRDWAAKGTLLLGVRAVLATSFERIHRSNLIGMGVLPLEFLSDQSAASLGLTGKELYSITGVAEGLEPGKLLRVTAEDGQGHSLPFDVRCRIDTPEEVAYYMHGGILNYVLRELCEPEPASAV